MDRGADVNAPDEGERTALEAASTGPNASKAIVRLLLDNGADVTSNPLDAAYRNKPRSQPIVGLLEGRMRVRASTSNAGEY